MASATTDTDGDSLGVLTALYRKMEPREKLDRVRDLTLAASQLALAGLRARHPHEPERHLLLRLARIRLGHQLVAAAYTDDPTVR
jgi:hypothetical protein